MKQTHKNKKKKIADKSRSKNYWNWKYTKARRIRRRWNCVYWQCQRSLSDPKSKRTPSIRHFLRLRSPSYNKRSSERVLKSIDWTPLSSMQIRIKKKCFDTFYSAFCGNLWRWELEGERDKHGTRTWPWKSRTIYVNARVLIGKYILALYVGDHPRDCIPLDDARHGYSYMECGVHVRQVCMGNITNSILYVMTYER